MKNDAKFKIRDSKLHNSLVVPDEIYPNIISEISDFVHLRGLALWAGFVVSSLRLNPSSVAGGGRATKVARATELDDFSEIDLLRPADDDEIPRISICCFY
jgi:hypothetical protein